MPTSFENLYNSWDTKKVKLVVTGKPKRDRSKNKAARQARKRNR